MRMRSVRCKEYARDHCKDTKNILIEYYVRHSNRKTQKLNFIDVKNRGKNNKNDDDNDEENHTKWNKTSKSAHSFTMTVILDLFFSLS